MHVDVCVFYCTYGSHRRQWKLLHMSHVCCITDGMLQRFTCLHDFSIVINRVVMIIYYDETICMHVHYCLQERHVDIMWAAWNSYCSYMSAHITSDYFLYMLELFRKCESFHMLLMVFSIIMFVCKLYHKCHTLSSRMTARKSAKRSNAAYKNLVTVWIVVLRIAKLCESITIFLKSMQHTWFTCNSRD